MSLFGKIMAFIAFIWTALLVLNLLGSPDIYEFMRGSIMIYILGYVGIGIFTVVMKKLVEAM